MANQDDFEAVNELLGKHVKQCIKRQRVIRFSLILLFLMVITFVLVTFVVEIELIHGDSMINTLKSGSLALSIRNAETIHRGDVIVVRNTEDDDYIKRIVAVPGDTVDIDDENGTLIINGERQSEIYVIGRTHKKSADCSVTLGDGEYYVMGDNREHSYDSRDFGKIDKNRIGGVVILPKTN